MSFLKKIITSLLPITLVSCTVFDGNNSASGSYLPTATSPGLMAVELNDDPSYAEPYMNKNCMNYGGLNRASIMKTKGKWSFGYTYWSYSCNGLPAPQKFNSHQFQPPSSVNNNLDAKSQLDEAKVKCADLGFKQGTEGFGKCVLKLSK